MPSVYRTILWLLAVIAIQVQVNCITSVLWILIITIPNLLLSWSRRLSFDLSAYILNLFRNVKQGSTYRSSKKAVVLICRLPVADDYRPRISNYVGLFNGCLIERVLTESMISRLYELQQQHEPQKLKIYVCCRGAGAATKMVSSWLTHPPDYTAFKRKWWPVDYGMLVQYYDSVQRNFRKLIPKLVANSHANAREISPQGNQNFRSTQEIRHGRKSDPVSQIIAPINTEKEENLRDVTFIPSVGESQSEMMENCLRKTFRDGCKQTVFVNLHAPDMSPRIVNDAFRTLQKGVDVVLGRSSSRGCYLVGVRSEPFADGREKMDGLFSFILWNTGNVYSTMFSNCFNRERKLTVASMRPILKNIDSYEDLYLIERAIGLSTRHLAESCISVVMPIFNEENVAVKSIQSLVRNYTGLHGKLEIVIVDGHSLDSSVQQILEFRAEVAPKFDNAPLIDIQVHQLPEDVKPGWDAQVRYGIERAHGAYYLILHADSLLGPNWDDMIVRCLNRPGVVAGVFHYMAAVPNAYVWQRHFRWAVFAHLLNFIRFLCTSHLAHTTGEQGLFMHAFYFQLMDGMSGLGIADLPGGMGAARKCLKHGALAVCNMSVVSLPRRWVRRGLFKGLCIEGLLMMARRVGLSTERITNTYHQCPRVPCEAYEIPL